MHLRLPLAMRFTATTGPRRVRNAIIALCIAWLLSAAALAVNQLVFRGAGIGPGPALGIMNLAVQAIMIMLIAQRSSMSRMLAVAYFIVALSTLPMVPRLIGQGALISASYLVLAVLLKGAATWLLFTGESRAWFDSRQPI